MVLWFDHVKANQEKPFLYSEEKRMEWKDGSFLLCAPVSFYNFHGYVDTSSTYYIFLKVIVGLTSNSFSSSYLFEEFYRHRDNNSSPHKQTNKQTSENPLWDIIIATKLCNVCLST